MVARPESEIWRYQQLDLGFNYRMTDIHAALGLSQMSSLDDFVRKRHQIASEYNSRIDKERIALPRQDPATYSSYHLFPICVQNKGENFSQRGLTSSLIEQGINVNHHYIPVYLHPYYEALGFRRGYCAEAENYFRQTISLPIYPELTPAEQQRVCAVVDAYLAKQ